MLFGGFRPLFQALSPADMNRLSYEIIQVFQGEGGTVESLLAHVASLTNSLADKDAVIGSVIDNLTTVLGTVAARDQKLSDLIVNLQQFVTGLATDRDAIFNSLQTIDTLATTTSGLARRRPVRRWPPTSSGLGKLSTNLADTARRARGLPQAGADEDRPDHADGHQRQLVQLLPVLGRAATSSCRAPGPTVSRPASPSPRAA